MSQVYEIAEQYVERYAALDPIAATSAGIAGHDHELTDYSPAGAEARAALARDTLVALARAPHERDGDRIAAAVMRERLTTALDHHDAGERLRDLRIIGSPVQAIRQCFDLMPYDTPDDWEVARDRMQRVPQAVAGVEAALREGMARGIVAARRQALACAQQADTWSGESPFFRELADRHPGDPRLADAAEAATAAYARLARFLRDEYAPAAEPRDPVGRERYALFARSFNGIDLDLEETYEWGWEELYRIERDMRAVAERVLPGEPLEAVIEHLEHDDARSIDGVEEFRRWNQDLIDRTIAALDGRHFDIAAPLRRCEAMIAPPGGAAAMYYTGPSEDFSRPGRTWYPTLGRTRFPLWREVSICYHEAVPGHHLQVGQVKFLADRLSRYQRAFGFVSGHGEGWALYAERLMAELGYFDDPAWELGMLSAQAMRAVRVVVDIGMHLELASREHDGARWTPELALPFVVERSRFPEDFMRSEVDRYLGWPGQAISYKAGERVWLECRADAQRRLGGAFDLKAFHTYALDLGSMGLATLREELGRFGPPTPGGRDGRHVPEVRGDGAAATGEALAGFEATRFEHGGVARTVYRGGSGPGVVVIHELPGLTPPVAAFGRRLVDAGFTVAMPVLAGTPGRPMSPGYVARSLAGVCVSREFTTWATKRTSPVIEWLRALARDLYRTAGGPGVGAVGMCFSGGFALAMAVDDELRAPVCSQPSLPFPVGAARARDLGLAPDDLARVAARDDLCVMALRFTHDRAVPTARFERLREVFGDRLLAVEIDNPPGNPHGIRRMAHSVLTEDLVDEPGHPTRDALDRVLAFLRERLGA